MGESGLLFPSPIRITAVVEMAFTDEKTECSRKQVKTMD